MTTVLLVIHLMIAAALVGLVLFQRSEGGALGIGGGGGGGGFMTGRGTANLVTRMTAALAAGFFATSMLLSILSGGIGSEPASIIDQLGGSGSSSSAPATSGTGTGSTGGTPGDAPTTGGSSTSGGSTTPGAPQSQ